MEESKSRRCQAKKSDGTPCTLFALVDSEEPFCHYHHPKRAELLKEIGRSVGLLPKIRTGEIMKIDSVEDILQFAKRRMSLISRRGNIPPRMREELIQRWAQFILPILKDRDDLKERLDRLEKGYGGTNRKPRG